MTTALLEQPMISGDPDCTYKLLEVQSQAPLDPDSGIDTVVYMTTDSVDDDAEVMLSAGCDMQRFNKNRVLMLCHSLGEKGSYYPLPIGRVEWTKIRPRGILGGITFAQSSDMGREVKGLWDEGMLRAVSVGFTPLEASQMTRQEAESRADWKAAYEKLGGRILVHRRWKLLELSIVPVPANEDALRIKSRSKGVAIPSWLNISPEVSPMSDPATPDAADVGGTGLPALPEPQTKGMVPYHGYPVVEDAWDAGKATKQFKDYATGADGSIDFAKYEKAFAYCDDAEKDKQGAYHYPHHYVEGGKIVTCKAGVIAAVAAAHGARSGSKPQGADEALAHLKKHYAEMGMDFPESGKAMDEPEEPGEPDEPKEPGEKAAKPKEDEKPDGKPKDDEADPAGGKAMDKGAMCKAIADVAAKVKHSGERGHAYYSHDEKAVHHDMADEDDGDEKFDQAHEIKAMYRAGCKGLKRVHVGVETGHPGEGYEKVYPPKGGMKAVMTEGVGQEGGFGVPSKPTEVTADGPPIVGETDEDGDNDQAGDEKSIKRGHFVKFVGGGRKGVGHVVSVHAAGDMVPHVHDDVMGTPDEPAARVRMYKAFGDGHLPTSHYVGHHTKHLEKIDDLKPPTEKPKKAAKGYVEDLPDLPEPRAELPALPAAQTETVAKELKAALSPENIEAAIAIAKARLTGRTRV